MRYRASFLAYAFWMHKNATPKNWLMWVKGLKHCCKCSMKRKHWGLFLNLIQHSASPHAMLFSWLCCLRAIFWYCSCANALKVNWDAKKFSSFESLLVIMICDDLNFYCLLGWIIEVEKCGFFPEVTTEKSWEAFCIEISVLHHSWASSTC